MLDHDILAKSQPSFQVQAGVCPGLPWPGFRWRVNITENRRRRWHTSQDSTSTYKIPNYTTRSHTLHNRPEWMLAPTYWIFDTVVGKFFQLGQPFNFQMRKGKEWRVVMKVKSWSVIDSTTQGGGLSKRIRGPL